MFSPKTSQASKLVLMWSKRGRLNHRFVFKKCGHFLKRFSTSKTFSKSTALFPLFLQRFHVARDILHILFAERGLGAVAAAFDFAAFTIL